MDPDLTQELTNWHYDYQNWAQREDVRALLRADHHGIYVYERDVIPVRATRGSIEQRYPDGRLGHWYSFFRQDGNLILYDPSYPVGPYYIDGNDLAIVQAVQLMDEGNGPVMFYEIPVNGTPLQIHHQDSFCQTWSMLAITSGNDAYNIPWQTRQVELEHQRYETRAEKTVANSARLDLLFDFIAHWLSLDADPVARSLEARFRRLRVRWHHYYMSIDWSGGRRLIPDEPIPVYLLNAMV